MTLNCNDKIIDFNTQKIMGILNLSKDSFYDGGKYSSLGEVISRVSEMIDQGAEIIDIGVPVITDRRPEFFRISSRKAPHNLYADTYKLKNLAISKGYKKSNR